MHDSRQRFRCGNRTHEEAVMLECPRGHQMVIREHRTVPPCSRGSRDARCGAVDFVRLPLTKH
jgi:hypothetical protein